MLLQISLITLFLWYMMQRWQSRNMRRIAKQFKTHYRTFPFIGSAHIFIGDGEKKMRIFQEIGRQAFENNGWSGFWLGTIYHAVVADPKEAEHIMKTHLEKAEALNVTRDLIGDASIFAPVAIWRPRRKILMPSFKQRNLNAFMGVFSKQSSILLEQLSEVANGKPFSIWNFITSYSMDSICHTTLGVNIGVQKNRDHRFLKWLREYANISATRFVSPWLHNDYVYKFIRYWDMWPRSQECIRGINGFVLDIVHSKRAELKRKNSTKKIIDNQINKENKNETDNLKPILELLIEASGREKGYTDTELRQETEMLLAAGTDTSAVAISFTVMMLANHPNVQDKVYDELQHIYGDSDRPVTAGDVLQMHYLEMVIKETLRLYPPVPITARQVIQDDVTPAGVQLVPGLAIVVHHWAIHRNPKYWGDDADIFRPERFADCPPTHPSAFIPFSCGPRNCVGFLYTMMSMKAAISSLVRRYRLLPSDPHAADKPLRVSYEVMMKHVDNFELKLESRKRVKREFEFYVS